MNSDSATSLEEQHREQRLKFACKVAASVQLTRDRPGGRDVEGEALLRVDDPAWGTLTISQWTRRGKIMRVALAHTSTATIEAWADVLRVAGFTDVRRYDTDDKAMCYVDTDDQAATLLGPFTGQQCVSIIG